MCASLDSELEKVARQLESCEVLKTQRDEGEEYSRPRYDNRNIFNDSRTFNLEDTKSKPDLRNAEYRSPTDNLMCPICQQPFFEPLTTVCGHTYCKECIYECLKMSKGGDEPDMSSGYCPLDRTPIHPANANELFPTPLVIINLVDDLKVFCLNMGRGCGWVGSRWELEHHVIADCEYTGVKCSGKRECMDGVDEETICDLLVERRFLSEDNRCVHKLYQCKNCTQELCRISEEVHLTQECLFNYETCEICGNDLIPSKNMTKHKENCSHVGHIKCPASQIGCQWRGSNKTSLEIHTQENNCQLNQFLPHYKSMNSKIDSLTDENQFLQRQINKILNSIVQGKITNLGYNESLEEVNKGEVGPCDKVNLAFYELDRLKFEIEEKIVPYLNKNQSDESQPVLNSLINSNFILKEEMNIQRIILNSIRKQVQFLLFSRGNSRNFLSQPMDESTNDVLGFSSRNSSDERLNLKL